MPFLTLNNDESSLAEYYNSITTEGVFIGTQNNPNVTGTEKPKIPETLYTDFDDGFIRGGVNNVALSVARDTTRLFKFLTGTAPTADISLKNIGTDPDKLRGYLFLAKQASLQLTNPRLEWDQRDALPPFLGGPTRQFTGAGIIESIAGTAFGLHFDRAGLLGKIRDDQKYGGDIDNPNGITYRNNFGDGNNNSTINSNAHNRLVRYLSKISTSTGDGNSIVLDRYFGGPDSVYGVGWTTVRTSYDSKTIIRGNDLGVPEKTESITTFTPPTLTADLVNSDNTVVGTATSPDYSFGNLWSSTPLSISQGPPPQPVVKQIITPAIAANPKVASNLNGFTPLFNSDINRYDNNILSNTIGDKIQSSKVISNSPFYNKPSTVSKPGYTTEDTYGVTGGGSADSINVINIVDSKVFYEDNKGQRNSGTLKGKDITGKDVLASKNVDGDFSKDLIKFRLEFLNNEKAGYKSGNSVVANTDVLAFRAYLDSFDDGLQAKWNSYRYMGRGEDFYIYEGFSRDISVSFVMHAHTDEEMIPLYNKLNYLISTFTPDYNAQLKMRGNIGYLTVGDYLYRQPGVFSDIKISGFFDGSWQTGLVGTGDNNFGDLELPRMLKISLSFKPIHTFLPRKVNPTQNVPYVPFIGRDLRSYPMEKSPTSDGTAGTTGNTGNTGTTSTTAATTNATTTTNTNNGTFTNKQQPDLSQIKSEEAFVVVGKSKSRKYDPVWQNIKKSNNGFFNNFFNQTSAPTTLPNSPLLSNINK